MRSCWTHGQAVRQYGHEMIAAFRKEATREFARYQVC
jgi:hypothetical protein